MMKCVLVELGLDESSGSIGTLDIPRGVVPSQSRLLYLACDIARLFLECEDS